MTVTKESLTSRAAGSQPTLVVASNAAEGELPPPEGTTPTVASTAQSEPVLATRTTELALRGNVDTLERGILRGWAWDPTTPNKSVEIVALVETTLVGTATANQFRADLKTAGVGTGRHGFSLVVSDLLPHAGRTIHVLTRDGKPVVTFPIPEHVSRDGISVESALCQGYAVELSIVSEVVVGQTSITVSEAATALGTADTFVGAGLTRVTVPLLPQAFDDRSHLITIGIDRMPTSIGSAVVELRSIATPWEHLSTRLDETPFASLSPHSKARYDSLTRQLRHIAESKSPSLVDDIQRAHAVVMEGWETRKKFPPISLPSVDSPRVSIIVPAHNQFALTYHAVASVVLAYNDTSYEVIVVDDASTDETSELEAIIANARVVRNEKNLGFLRSVNRAASEARGEFLFLLNNDTEVRSLFLDEVIAPFSDPSVGMTGSKLLNLDGTIQEAGGVVWGSGQPWNLGRNQPVYAPEWNYAREVDYISGAALCIRRSLWNTLGGFSDEFAPAYYEDTDLAFKVRASGFRTLYVPTSEVVHFEGKSNGRDVTKGIKRYQVVNETTFRRKWMHAFRTGGAEGVDVHLAKDRNVDYRVLAIDYATPNPASDAGSYAAVREMELLRALGCKVTFVPENMAHIGALTRDLQRRGVEVLHAPNYSSVHDVLERRGREFDCVYITRFEVAERCVEAVRRHSKARIIFCNADLHFLRLLRSQLANGETDLSSSLRVRDRELALIRQVDAMLSYSPVEQAVVLSHNLRYDNIYTCPWVLDEKPAGPARSEREGIAFLGGFRHPPNLEAVRYLAKEILPALRRTRPGIVLHVYGSNAPKELLDLESDDLVVEGFVESLDQVFHRHRVFVAPLLSGAGIKGKVLEAMAYGTPSVLTPVAAEATGLQNGVSALISETPSDLARDIARLYDDAPLWEKISSRSRELAEAKFSREEGLRAFEALLAGVQCWPRANRTTVGW